MEGTIRLDEETKTLLNNLWRKIGSLADEVRRLREEMGKQREE